MRLRIRSAPLVVLTALGIMAVPRLWAGAANATLPLNVAPTLGEVQRFFPDLARRAHTGPDPAAQGSPKGTIAAVFITADGKKTVTATVAQYASPTAAYAAFRESAARARSAANPVALPRRIGQRSFCVVGAKTAFAVVGALDGALVVEASLKGYRLDKTTVEKLVALTRMADEIAAAALL
jgi:hypothetical protein